jgi:hypothetical protein
MSRQYPEEADIYYFITWVEQKIIQVAKNDGATQFANTAALARSITFYLSSIAGAHGRAEIWLRRRYFNSFHALQGMRRNEDQRDIFLRHEEDLIDTLKYIVEYYEENGFFDPNLTSAADELLKVRRPPRRWITNYPEDF